MRRKDREIESTNEIIDILKRCNTLSIGFKGEEFPYVVPVSFGVVQENNNLIVFFHGAKQGYKIDMIENNSKVCLEGHIFHNAEPTEDGITTHYESVIGFGTVKRADENEILSGLKSITEHYNYAEYPVDSCKGLQMTAVYKILVHKLTGKRNMAE